MGVFLGFDPFHRDLILGHFWWKEFQFKLFVKGKELWGHIDGSNPTPRDVEALSKWEIKDTRFTIKTTLLGIFNWSMRWLISHKEVSQLRNIFSGFQTLWVDYSDIVYANVPVEALSAIQTVHNCPKKFCNYCKKQGHIISACPIRLERKQGTAYHASTDTSSYATLPVVSSVVPIPAPIALANLNTLTPKMDQVLGKMIAKEPKVGRLFPLHVSPSTIIPSLHLFSYACNVVGSGHKMWHRRLGHLNFDVLRTLFNSRLLGKKHVLLLIFLSIVRHANLAKVLRLDSGREYTSNEFQDFFQSKWIISQRSCPSTPQQNGVAERKNHHLLDVVRTLLLDSSIPPRFWCETLSTAVHLINHLPCPMLNHVSHFSKLFGHSPLYSDLRTFGCVCFVHLPTHEQHKLTAQFVKCAFLGYTIPHKGYVCCDPHAHRIRVSRNVIFFENQYFFPSHVELPSASVSLLPSFSESLTILERFKPGFVYERHSRHEFGSTSSMPSFDLDLTPDPAPAFTTLRLSTHIFRPPDCQYDSSFFFHTSASGTILLLVYVDDIVITGTDCGLIAKLQRLLHTTFHMKDLGQLTYFLGLEVHHRANGIFDTAFVETPMEINVKYRKDEGDLLDDPILYRRLVGSLIYLTTTRPDISYVVHQVSQFMTSPWHLYLVVVQLIIRYLRGSPTRGCKKQDRVSKSSTEAEYHAISTTCFEIVWLHGLLEELVFPQTMCTPLHADNTSAIQIATNPVFHEHTKHIEVDCHSI
uniref:Uncharacterized protein n=1 Tax=Vitis vinifera TaxID=29760 RepID=A5BE74_VITVI|nr:hypothetical protein VITISV_017566 [Vitis vinifera]